MSSSEMEAYYMKLYKFVKAEISKDICIGDCHTVIFNLKTSKSDDSTIKTLQGILPYSEFEDESEHCPTENITYAIPSKVAQQLCRYKTCGEANVDIVVEGRDYCHFLPRGYSKLSREEQLVCQELIIPCILTLFFGVCHNEHDPHKLPCNAPVSIERSKTVHGRGRQEKH